MSLGSSCDLSKPEYRKSLLKKSYYWETSLFHRLRCNRPLSPILFYPRPQQCYFSAGISQRDSTVTRNMKEIGHSTIIMAKVQNYALIMHTYFFPEALMASPSQKSTKGQTCKGLPNPLQSHKINQLISVPKTLPPSKTVSCRICPLSAELPRSSLWWLPPCPHQALSYVVAASLLILCAVLDWVQSLNSIENLFKQRNSSYFLIIPGI